MFGIISTFTDAIRGVIDGVTSREAQKAYIRAFLASILAFFLLCLAAAAYILFYLNFIPQIDSETYVHMMYGTPRFSPYGSAMIGSKTLVHGQAYDVHAILTMPTSQSNYELSNFMVGVTLYGRGGQGDVLAVSNRQTMLTYKSPIVLTLETVMRSPLYLTGWKREEEKLDILMMAGATFDRNQGVPVEVGVALGNEYSMKQSTYPEIYDVKVRFKAKFSGMRYIMYNFRITSFLLFTTIFFFTELFWAGLAWVFISTVLFPSSSGESGEITSSSYMDKRGRSTFQSQDIFADDEETENDMGGAPTPTTDVSTVLHPLAPADDDDDEDIPRPRRGIYATPEGTPAPERGEEGDVEDEEDSESYPVDDSASEDEASPTLIEQSRLGGGATDSGVGSSRSEGVHGGAIQRRRSGKK